MTQKARIKGLLRHLESLQPLPTTELSYQTPFQLLVAVVLSAQCTDKRVNMVTKHLFIKFPTPYEMAEASFEELFTCIQSISYPNNKTKHLLATAKKLVHEHQGQIPQQRDALQQLPGVGRKTANVLSSVLYDAPVIAVDTHVFRVARRMGLVSASANTPLKVEQQLTQAIPPSARPKAHHWLILHGRYTCLARKPRCEACSCQTWCTFFAGLQVKK